MIVSTTSSKFQLIASRNPNIRSKQQILIEWWFFEMISQREKIKFLKIAFWVFPKNSKVWNRCKKMGPWMLISCIYGFTCVRLRLGSLFKGWNLRGEFWIFQMAVNQSLQLLSSWYLVPEILWWLGTCMDNLVEIGQ